MDIWFALVAIVSLVIGIVVGWFFASKLRSATPASESLALSTRVTRAETAEAGLRDQLAMLEKQLNEERERLRLQQTAHQQRLDALAEEHQQRLDELREQTQARIDEQVTVREQRAAELTKERELQAEEQAKREAASLESTGRVLKAIAPVQEHLRSMQQKITELEQQRQSQYGTLSEQLIQARRSDEQLRQTTDSLKSALSNNSTRGAWGEAQLRNIVESAGLTERVDFVTQSSVDREDARYRPDMILKIPGGKSVPIDAKVPFNSYIEANEIPSSAGSAELARRDALLAKHVKAVRAHIDTLASKQYWAALDASPEFVVAFIPSESLLSAALDTDPTLLEYAFNKRVALASPVTLWSVLKTVAYAWQQEILTDEAKTLFDLSKEMLERINVLARHADKLRGAIDSTVKHYNAFASTLESRVLVSARKLGKLDESKVVPQAKTVDELPKSFTAPELTQSELEAPFAEHTEPKSLESQVMLEVVAAPDDQPTTSSPGVDESDSTLPSR